MYSDPISDESLLLSKSVLFRLFSSVANSKFYLPQLLIPLCLTNKCVCYWRLSDKYALNYCSCLTTSTTTLTISSCKTYYLWRYIWNSVWYRFPTKTKFTKTTAVKKVERDQVIKQVPLQKQKQNKLKQSKQTNKTSNS